KAESRFMSVAMRPRHGFAQKIMNPAHGSGRIFQVLSTRVPLGLASKVTVGPGQYRNAVASGRCWASITEEYRSYKNHPTLPRYGTDIIQVRIVLLRQSRPTLTDSLIPPRQWADISRPYYFDE